MLDKGILLMHLGAKGPENGKITYLKNTDLPPNMGKKPPEVSQATLRKCGHVPLLLCVTDTAPRHWHRTLINFADQDTLPLI